MKRVLSIIIVGLCLVMPVWAQNAQDIDAENVTSVLLSVIGSGYDIIGEYASEDSLRAPIFTWVKEDDEEKESKAKDFVEDFMGDDDLFGDDEQEKIPPTKTFRLHGKNLTLPRVFTVRQLSDMAEQAFSGTDSHEYGTSIAASLNIEAGYAGFSGGFGLSGEQRTNETKTTVFSTIESITRIARVGVNQSSIRSLQQYLTSEARQIINSEKIPPQQVFELYGTHALLSAEFGGKFDLSMTTTTETEEKAEKLKATIKASYSMVVTASMDASVETTEEVKDVMTRSSITVRCRGGDYAKAIRSTEELKDYDQRSAWLASIPRAVALVGLVDKNSLLPIWQLARTRQRQEELRRAYETYIASGPDEE